MFRQAVQKPSLGRCQLVMLIGEVSQASGVTVKALRYYESAGLIDPPKRTAGGYRDYPPAILGRLTFIRAAQAVDLSLGDLVAFALGWFAPSPDLAIVLEAALEGPTVPAASWGEPPEGGPIPGWEDRVPAAGARRPP